MQLYRELNDLRGVLHRDTGEACECCADKLKAREEIHYKTTLLRDRQAALRD